MTTKQDMAREDASWRLAMKRTTLLPGGIMRTDYITPLRTRTVLVGPQPRIFQAHADYLRDYNPIGYGTRQVECTVGVQTARYIFERYNSK